MRSLSVVASLALFLSGAAGFKPPRIPVPEPLAAERDELTKVHTFQQLIDHKNPELGTFPQRYWYNDEWWKGEGSPVGCLVDTYSDLANGKGCPLYSWGSSSAGVHTVSYREHNDWIVWKGDRWRGGAS